MKILSIIILTFTGMGLLHADGTRQYFKNYFPQPAETVNITVGTRINDSTGIVVITNSVIQSSIIQNIKFLTNANITGDAPTISLGQQYSFLVFRAISVMSKSIEVAVEIDVVGNELKFQNISGKQIHIWESKGTCTTCTFFQDRQKNTIGCNCSTQSPGNNKGGCDHFMFFTE